MNADLSSSARLVIDATLAPLAGTLFQPTGFPDLGAAEFRRPPDGETAVLVESVQSVANHLEGVGLDPATEAPVEPLAQLPYVRVEHADDGAFLTSSRHEPHRLASAYIREASIDGVQGTDWIADRLGLQPEHPLDWRSIYRAVWELDPLCLVHGVFFSAKGWHGNPKVRRALTAVVEAHGAEPVVSGGVKRDDVAFKHHEARGAEEGYGFVPFGRTEYVAREIRLTAVVDLAQIRGYGLDENATRFLTLVAQWELARLLAEPIRLRTFCDLDVVGVVGRRPEGFELPSADELAEQMASVPLSFEQEGARIARWPAKSGKAKT